jgi:hypothetical protein
MNDLQIGIGRSDITPAPGTPQGIWGACRRKMIMSYLRKVEMSY